MSENSFGHPALSRYYDEAMEAYSAGHSILFGPKGAAHSRCGRAEAFWNGFTGSTVFDYTEPAMLNSDKYCWWVAGKDAKKELATHD